MATHAQVAHRWAQDDATARTVRAERMFYERFALAEREGVA